MKGFRSFRAAAFLILPALLLLSGCGGGGGTSSGGGATPNSAINGVSSGAITDTTALNGERLAGIDSHASSGMIRVTGVSYSTSGASIEMDDDDTDREDQLEVGMVVDVDGSVDGERKAGTARAIHFENIIIGPVAQVNQAGKTLVVLGQNIGVDGWTRFKGKGVLGLASLAQGDMVKVSGLPGAGGTILATRIVKSGNSFVPNSTPVKLRGTVGSVSGQSFTIGALTVISTSPLPTGVVAGAFVKVKGVMSSPTSSLTATSIVVKKAPLEPDEGQLVRIDGIVANFVALENFTVNGVKVNALSTGVTGIANNLLVQVEGTMVNGILMASSVTILTSPPVPGPPPPSALSTLTVSPASVQGGTSSQGTATLDQAAPTGGITVNLSSNSPSAVVPATVAVPAAALSANFPITTSVVSSDTTATLTATYGGVSKTASLAITTAPPPPPPPIDGAALYGANCSGCHRPLATSSKRGASAALIQGAIDSNKGGMGAFSFLTPAEVAAIAAALNF